MTQPATRPHQRAFPPPFPRFDERSVGGRNPIEHCARVQNAAAQQFNDWRHSFSPNVTPEDRRDSANLFSVSDAAVALPAALDAARAHADGAQAKADAAVEAPKVDGTDVAALLAADRFWRRIERTLDSVKDGPKVAAAAHDLVRNASDTELPVNEELGPYLSSRGVPAGWLNAALAVRVPGADDLRADAALKAKRVAVLARTTRAW